MDEDSYYHFSIPAMELEGNSEEFGGDDQDESLSQSISLPSLPVSLQEQLVYPEIASSSTKNQVMSMKDLDEKLNALRRENFDLKVRLFCSSQNKGIPRFGEKYFVSSSAQTDGRGCLKPPNPIRLSHGSQTLNKLTCEIGIQTDPVKKVKCEDKITGTDHQIVSSVSIQTEASTSEEIVSSVDKMNSHLDQHRDHFKSIQLRLKEQLNQKSTPSPRQSKPLSTIPSASQANRHLDLLNSPSLIPQIKSQTIMSNGGQSANEFDLSLIYNQTSSMLYNPDKSFSSPKPKSQSARDAGISECELLADEIDSKIQILSKLSILGHQGKLKNRTRDSIQSSNNKSIDCDGTNSTLKSTTESFQGNHNQNSVNQFDHRSTSKIFDIINRQVDRPVNSGKKRDPMTRISSHEDGLDSNQNLITKPISKRLSKMFEDSENHQFASPDLGIGDSDHDLNSDLKAFIPLGYYQLLRCNLHQLSSHLNYLDNLYRDCFVLQSISLSEYSTEMKPSLTHLNQTINSSRNICKNFSIEDENAISLRLDKIKAKKESMEKAITRQLRKTDKLLRKAKANLRAN